LEKGIKKHILYAEDVANVLIMLRKGTVLPVDTEDPQK
jgi:hypothetical protein